jgi:Tfp pilus assembly PilM family ATPase
MHEYTAPKSTMLALDVTETALNGVFLAPRRYRQPNVQEYAVSLPPGVVDNGRIRDFVQFDAALERLCDSVGYKKDGIVSLTIPSAKTHVRVEEFEDPLSDRDPRVARAIENVVPLDPKRMYYDWQRLESFETLGKERVMTISIDRDVVEERKRIAQKIGVLGTLESRAFSSARVSVPRSTQGASVIVVSLDIDETSIFFLRNGVPHAFFTSSITIQTFVHALERECSWPQKESYRSLGVFSLDPQHHDSLMYNVLAPYLEVLMDDVREVVKFVEHEHDGEAGMTDICVCGIGSKIRGLSAFVRYRIGRPTRSYASKSVFSYIPQPQFYPGAGLLLRHFNNELFS